MIKTIIDSCNLTKTELESLTPIHMIKIASKLLQSERHSSKCVKMAETSKYCFCPGIYSLWSRKILCDHEAQNIPAHFYSMRSRPFPRDHDEQISDILVQLFRTASNDHNILYKFSNDKWFNFLKTRHQGLQLSFLNHLQIPYRLRDINFQSRVGAAEVCSTRSRNSFRDHDSQHPKLLFTLRERDLMFAIAIHTSVDKIQQFKMA